MRYILRSIDPGPKPKTVPARVLPASTPTTPLADYLKAAVDLARANAVARARGVHVEPAAIVIDRRGVHVERQQIALPFPEGGRS